MHTGLKTLGAGVLGALLLAGPGWAKSTKRVDPEGKKVLWEDPPEISQRDLITGQGGNEHMPPGTTFEFVKEDLDGTNPKFNVRDASGTKWKIKLGDEARPETVASRLVWAVGFHTDDDYFLPLVHVSGLPEHVRRGRRFIDPDGSMHNVRVKLESGVKKLGSWSWADDPFTGTREWNGLRVMMAMINNWDLKDENNSVYEVGDKAERKAGEIRFVYVVSDLGASFGPDHLDLTRKSDKGDINRYRKTAFIRHNHGDRVDFSDPRAPSPFMIFNPSDYFGHLRLRWIGRNIPKDDARWMGTMLSQLSPRQIRDAFRAGGYSPEAAEAFAVIVERRIRELSEL